MKPRPILIWLITILSLLLLAPATNGAATLADLAGFWQAGAKSTLSLIGLGNQQKQQEALVKFDPQNMTFSIDESANDYYGAFSLRLRDWVLICNLDEQAYPQIQAMLSARISDLAAQKGKTISNITFKNFKIEILPAVLPKTASTLAKMRILGGAAIQVLIDGKAKTLPLVYSEEITFGQKLVADAAAVIGPAGGTVAVTEPASPIYGAKIQIPLGAVTEPLIVTMNLTNFSSQLPTGFTTAGPMMSLGPNGTSFLKEIYVTLPYDDSDHDGIIDYSDTTEDQLAVLSFNVSTENWDSLNVVNQDSEGNTITALMNHFTCVGTSIPASYSDKKIKIFTIDGLSFGVLLADVLDQLTQDIVDFLRYFRTGYLDKAIPEIISLGEKI